MIKTNERPHSNWYLQYTWGSMISQSPDFTKHHCLAMVNRQSRSKTKLRDFQNRFLQPRPLVINSHILGDEVPHVSYQGPASVFWDCQSGPKRLPGGNRRKRREFLAHIVRFLSFLNILLSKKDWFFYSVNTLIEWEMIRHIRNEKTFFLFFAWCAPCFGSFLGHVLPFRQ